jgi:hypothetical protein
LDLTEAMQISEILLALPVSTAQVFSLHTEKILTPLQSFLPIKKKEKKLRNDKTENQLQ